MKAEPKSNVRPNHKKAIKLAALQAEINRQHPEPLSLFNQRLNKGARYSLLDQDVDTVQKLRREATLGRIEKAAIASAEWNNADPFAYGRTALYVKQGWVDPIEAEKEFRLRTIARKAAKAKEVEFEKATAKPSV